MLLSVSVQAGLAMAWKAFNSGCWALGHSVCSVALGAASVTKSLQFALCCLVIDIELDHASVVCLWQPVFSG